MKATAACGIAALGICDWLWARHAGLTFSHWTQTATLMGLLLALGFVYGSIRRNAQLADMALWGALVAAFTFAAAIFTYLMATLGFSFVDSELARVDAGLGFSWPAWFQFVNSHSLLKGLFAVVYAILLPECVASIVYFAHRGRSERNGEFLWGALISILITGTISGIVPAAGAFVHFGVPGPAEATYLPHLLALREGTASSFSMNEIQGIITMPSYHTVLAILIIYAYRGCGRLFAVALALNGVMLLSLPSEGGHYLIDVIAGGAIAAVTIAIVSAAARTRWWRRLSGADAKAHRPDAGKRIGEERGVSF
ncbi:MAG: phosphatase PAP2 family protein [Burkholderiaceae bacterium]